MGIQNLTLRKPETFEKLDILKVRYQMIQVLNGRSVYKTIEHSPTIQNLGILVQFLNSFEQDCHHYKKNEPFHNNPLFNHLKIRHVQFSYSYITFNKPYLFRNIQAQKIIFSGTFKLKKLSFQEPLRSASRFFRQ